MTANSRKVRHSVIAGRWYPGTAGALRNTLDEYLAEAPDADLGGAIIGLIAPHAGYAFSGPVAAYSYKQIQGKSYDCVIIISPLHSLNLGQYAVSNHTHYETPLGLIPIDMEMVAALGEKVSINLVERDNEHSLEIQLPFLQRVLSEFQILPIMMGAQDMASCRSLARAISDLAQDRETLLVASSDLAHVSSQQRALSLDRVFLEDMQDFQPERLSRHLASGETAACGGGPVVTVMLAAQDLGAREARILKHMTSYDVTGDESYVVGYAAGVLLGPVAAS